MIDKKKFLSLWNSLQKKIILNNVKQVRQTKERWGGCWGCISASSGNYKALIYNFRINLDSRRFNILKNDLSSFSNFCRNINNASSSDAMSIKFKFCPLSFKLQKNQRGLGQSLNYALALFEKIKAR